MSLRFLRRAVALVLVLSAAVVRYWMIRVRGPLHFGEAGSAGFKTLVSACCGAWEFDCEVEGEIPTRGLVVANHLSYLDIVILSAAMPCFFVAKAEIERVVLFRQGGAGGGTLFIDRSRTSERGEGGRVNQRAVEAASAGFVFSRGHEHRWDDAEVSLELV